jgi:hypothetical protein
MFKSDLAISALEIVLYTYVMMSDLSVYSDLYLRFIERKYVRTLAVIAAMDAEVLSLLKRFESAREKGHKVASYNLRLRISITEGVRFMYVQYSNQLASQISLLRLQIYNQVVVMFDEQGDEIFVDSLNNSLDFIDDDGDDDDNSLEDSSDEMHVDETLAAQL